MTDESLIRDATATQKRRDRRAFLTTKKTFGPHGYTRGADGIAPGMIQFIDKECKAHATTVAAVREMPCPDGQMIAWWAPTTRITESGSGYPFVGARLTIALTPGTQVVQSGTAAGQQRTTEVVEVATAPRRTHVALRLAP